ncbi:MAG TPA: alpha/beta hydrolase-fold protein [Gaiellaceae bacterium]|nr:alpha/beta hydrolase-fold protein [Gaiellaceae bacterium]
MKAGRWLALLTVVAGGAFLAVGFVGVDRYGRNYWLYRGFPPPSDPAFVHQRGTVEHIKVRSAALGGRSQDVYVYLPPGYAQHPQRRYPVLYLLHGFPGRPLAFILTVRMGVVEDELVAKRQAQPLILVMPFGSTGMFTDKEWANGVGSAEGWGTFVTRDVVHAVDARYRTIATGRGRAIGGLSEGGYGAINLAMQHPREFSLVESWSGYERAAANHSIFGRSLAGLERNSPLDRLRLDARGLRRLHTYFWIYTGTDDSLRQQNEQFARALAKAHVAHRYLELAGGHNWALWRGMAWRSYLTAAQRLAHG